MTTRFVLGLLASTSPITDAASHLRGLVSLPPGTGRSFGEVLKTLVMEPETWEIGGGVLGGLLVVLTICCYFSDLEDSGAVRREGGEGG